MAKSVLLIGNYPPPYGGVPTHIETLAPYLASRGWEVCVLSLKPSRERCRHLGNYWVYSADYGSREATLRLLLQYPVRVLHSASLALQDRAAFVHCLSLFRMAETIARKHEIAVISAYHLLPSGLVGAWLSRRLAVPLITTVFGEVYARPAYYRRRHEEVATVLQASAKLLSCSQHCAGSLGVLGLPAKVDVLYYGTDTHRLSPRVDGSTIRKQLGIGPSEKVVLYVGRMVHEMGLGILLESVPRVLEVDPGVKFIIVGRDGELRELAMRVARQMGQGRVLVIPDVAPTDLPSFYAASTVLVAPSVNERACLGLAIVEAMASGKPAVATSVGGGPEVVVPGETGLLVPPNDPTALAEAMLRLLDDPEACERMGNSARARAEVMFDQRVTNSTMDNMLRTVCHD